MTGSYLRQLDEPRIFPTNVDTQPEPDLIIDRNSIAEGGRGKFGGVRPSRQTVLLMLYE